MTKIQPFSESQLKALAETLGACKGPCKGPCPAMCDSQNRTSQERPPYPNIRKNRNVFYLHLLYNTLH